ncbi:MAG: HepT-like ribonuclease domain-containing protein [Nocardioidaceae bacterium]
MREMIHIIDDSAAVLARGEELFHDLANPVEYAAARMHVLDLDTAADQLRDETRDGTPGVPWRALARTRDKYAHHHEDIDRTAVWNVLAVDFPRIKAELERHLAES